MAKAVKMHGLGNSFVLMDLLNEYDDVPGNAELTGIIKTNLGEREKHGDGFSPDGYLLVLPSDNLDFTMKYFDIDRSTKEPVHASMCGNGIRCFSRYVFDNHSSKREMDIMTDDGQKRVQVIGDHVRINMGPPREYQKLSSKAHFVNSSLAHMVYFLDVMDLYNDFHRDIAKSAARGIANNQEMMDKLGHPEGLHVNYARVLKGRVSVFTYEPGVDDITLACGTGATAVGYAAHKAHGLRFPIDVQSLGGTLSIDMKGGNLYMKGPAEYIPSSVTDADGFRESLLSQMQSRYKVK